MDTGIEPYYAMVNGKRLRYGYTTGTCAAAAAQAAVKMLLTGERVDEAKLITPKGIPLRLPIEEPYFDSKTARCAVRKYSGDDPDVTDGILIFASVCRTEEPGVSVDGGEGVGRVTKPGLKQGIGEAAINSVPRKMIQQEAADVLKALNAGGGLRVIISVPEGAALAKKTFNPRLGIVGGISILGSSGIVEPMSEAAIIESIGLELRQKYTLGCRRALVTPGNYGADFLFRNYGVSENDLVKCSNYLGKTIDLAADAGFQEMLLVGHIGKLIKLSGGIMNSHSHEADARAELMACAALRGGCTADQAREILHSLTTDEMLRLLQRDGLLEPTMDAAAERIQEYIGLRSAGRIRVGAAVFSNGIGLLCTTGDAGRWLRELEEICTSLRKS